MQHRLAFAVFALLATPFFAFASGQYYVPQNSGATIYWTQTGSANCQGNTNYPNVADGIYTGWTQPHLGTGSAGGTFQGAGGNYYFNCSDMANGSAVVTDTANQAVVAPPTNVTASCNSSDVITISGTGYSNLPGTVYYPYRVDDQSDGSLTCGSSGDMCSDTNTASPVTVQGVAGHNYNVWVHTLDNGTWSPASSVVTVSCPAQVVATPGQCGTANGLTYSYGSSSYSPYTQCSAGTPSTTAFPAAGSSQSWTCSGTNGGATSPTCTAYQAAAASCPLPWGGNNLASGSSVTAYQVASGSSCPSQTRTCNNGTLSGSYTYQSCTVTGAAGSVTPTSCTIGSGGSSCTGAVSWSSSGTATASLTQNGTQVSTALTGSINPTPAVNPSSSITYNLYTGGGTLLASGVVSASCVSGSTWNGSSCAAASPTGTVTPTPCTVSAGSSSCTGSVSWTTSNTSTAYVTQNGTNVSTSLTGSISPTPNITAGQSITYNVYTSNGGTLLATGAVSATCAGGTTWNGTTCAASGSLGVTVSPSTYNAPMTSSLTVTYSITNGTASTQCRLLNSSQSAVTAWASCTGSLTMTVPNSLSTFTYYIQASSTGQTPTGQFTVTANNNPSISTSKNSCTIADGQSTCSTVTMNWSLGSTGYQVRGTDNGGLSYVIATTPSTQIAYPISPKYPSSGYFINNSSGMTVAGQINVTASCGSSSAWNSTTGTCQALPNSLMIDGVNDTTQARTLIASNSTIPSGGSGYNATIKWTTNAPVADTLYIIQRNNNPAGTGNTAGTLVSQINYQLTGTYPYSDSPHVVNSTTSYVNGTSYVASTGFTATISGPETEYMLLDNTASPSTPLIDALVRPSCVSGTTWNSSTNTCQAPTGCTNNTTPTGVALTLSSGPYTQSAPTAAGYKNTSPSSGGAYCWGNSGTNTYFVPQNTLSEFQTFWTALQNGVLSGMSIIN